MSKRLGLLHRSLALLVFVAVLTLGMFVSLPKEAGAYPDLTEGDCSQCHEDGRKAPEQPAQPAEPTQPTEPTQPSEPAQPAQPTQPIEPIQPAEITPPTQPAQGHVNNALLIGGLAVSLIAIGTAIRISKYKK